MMELLVVVFLGMLQGVTEFLPISSSAHLLFAEAFFQDHGIHLPDALLLNIVLHAGTLLAVVTVYWRRIIGLLQDRRGIGLLAVGTLPAVVVGLPLHMYCKESLESPLLAGCMLPLTGLLLIWSARRAAGQDVFPEMSYRQALIIGMLQAVAILPGISRSGTTIAAGLAVGLRRDAAATFSFLLAIPTILGACTLELKDAALGGPLPMPVGVFALGLSVSFLVGLLSLWWLLRWLEHGRLHMFAYWCVPMGCLMVIWRVWN
jgi:undecaprenyl-diphosphatase